MQAWLCACILVHKCAWSCPETLIFSILFLISHAILLSWIIFHIFVVLIFYFTWLLFVCFFTCLNYGLCCVFLFWCHEHAFTCSCMNAIGVELLQGKWGKSCIHIPMHLWKWFCLDDGDKHVCLFEFFLKYRCNHIFSWIFLCLCATLDMICMIVTC